MSGKRGGGRGEGKGNIFQAGRVYFRRYWKILLVDVSVREKMTLSWVRLEGYIRLNA